MNKMNPSIQATTIICVRKKGKVAIAGDGQVTLGETVIKHSAKKIRRLYNDKILAGFAGSSADSFALFSRFEAKLEQFHGNLSRAAVELAKDWRTGRWVDRHRLRRSVRACCSARAEQVYRFRRSRDCAGSDADRGENLHLHQREHHPGRIVSRRLRGFHRFDLRIPRNLRLADARIEFELCTHTKWWMRPPIWMN